MMITHLIRRVNVYVKQCYGFLKTISDFPVILSDYKLIACEFMLTMSPFLSMRTLIAFVQRL